MPTEVSLSGDLSLTVYTEADELPESWAVLAGDSSVFFSREYLKGLEDSEHKGFSFLYVMLAKNYKPGACFVFQLIDLSSVKIGSVIHSEPYGKFMKLAADKIRHSLLGRNEEHYILVNGSMYASGEFGILAREMKQEIAEVYFSVLDAIEKFVKGKVSVYIIKDFAFGNDYLDKTLSARNFSRFVMDPVMILNIQPDWETFEDYLSTLSSKYRLRAVNVIEKTSGFKLKELTAADINSLSVKLDSLYQAVIGKSPVRLMHPDIRYIYDLKKNLKDRFIVKAWFSSDEPVAFFTFLKGDTASAHHIGIDYHLNRQHALYQNILYQLIQLSIENGCKVLDYGRTALEMKSTVGAVPVNYAAYLKMNNRMLNHLIKPFLPSSPPSNWVQREPFRNGGGIKNEE